MKRSIKSVLERFPRLYLEVLRLKRRGHWSQQWIVRRDTQAVIEGFPRSANSFAQAAFLKRQPDTRLATHVHSSAQVIQACRWKIPTLVLLREPCGAVCGDVSFACELTGRDPQAVSAAEINDSLRRYIAFYKRVTPYRQDFVIARFADVVKDFGSVMMQFNERFGTAFLVFNHTKEAAAEITSLAFHVGPQVNRDNIKIIVQNKYAQNASAALKAKAEAVYLHLMLEAPVTSNPRAPRI